MLPPGLSAGQIDAAVRARTDGGEPIYELDEEALAELEPDLIVTQALCPVCAVSYDEVVEVAERIATCPQVVALDPRTFGETLADVRTLAQATDTKDAGVDLVQSIAARVDGVRVAVKDAPRLRVVAVEWLDPVYVAGHWTPQLVEMAGGVDVLGLPGEHSERMEWGAVAAARPDVVLCIPCGYDARRAHEEATRFAGALRATGATRAFAVDAAAYFSRPGPRLVDGLETLAHALHPELVPSAPGEVLEVRL